MLGKYTTAAGWRKSSVYTILFVATKIHRQLRPSHWVNSFSNFLLNKACKASKPQLWGIENSTIASSGGAISADPKSRVRIHRPSSTSASACFHYSQTPSSRLSWLSPSTHYALIVTDGTQFGQGATAKRHGRFQDDGAYLCPVVSGYLQAAASSRSRWFYFHITADCFHRFSNTK